MLAFCNISDFETASQNSYCNFSFFQVIGDGLGLRSVDEVGGKNLRPDLIAYDLVLRYEGRLHKALEMF